MTDTEKVADLHTQIAAKLDAIPADLRRGPQPSDDPDLDAATRAQQLEDAQVAYYTRDDIVAAPAVWRQAGDLIAELVGLDTGDTTFELARRWVRLRPPGVAPSDGPVQALIPMLRERGLHPPRTYPDTRA